MAPVAIVVTIGCRRPKMTIAPLIAPQSAPTASTPMTPRAVSNGEPRTIHDARQLVSVKVMPTERSMPAVITTSVCAIATKASSTPLLAAVCTTLVTAWAVKPLLAMAG